MVWLPVSSDTVFVTSVDCSICCMGTCGDYCHHPLYTRTDPGGGGSGEVQVDVHPETLGQSSLCWQIRGHVKMIGPELYLEQGKQLIVSVGDTLTDAGVAVGLIQPNRTSRYVISGNAITHTFRIEQSGIYRVFVLNRGKEVAKVEGEYGLR